MPLSITILTPSRCLLDNEACHQAELPGDEGRFGVLADHTPLVTPLAIGEIRLLDASGNVAQRLAVAGGFAEVTPQAIRVTAHAAEADNEIDTDRASAAKARAEKRLRARTEDIDVARAEAALARALNRLRVAGTSEDL